MYGVYTSTGGATTLTGTNVTTAGVGALGVLADGGGDDKRHRRLVVTTGTAAYAVAVNTGGAISLNGTTISATGNGSGGVGVIRRRVEPRRDRGSASRRPADFDPVSGPERLRASTTDLTEAYANRRDRFLRKFVPSPQAARRWPASTLRPAERRHLTGTKVDHDGGVGAIGVETNQRAASPTSAAAQSHRRPGRACSVCHRRGLNRQPERRRRLHDPGAGAIGLYAALGGVVSATGWPRPSRPPAAFRRRPASAPMASTPTARARRSTSARRRSRPPAPARPRSSPATRPEAAPPGTITATGTLNVKTTNASAAAVGLQGNGASVLATGGGTIVSAGTRSPSWAGRTRSQPSTISPSTTSLATRLRRSLDRHDQFQQHGRQRRSQQPPQRDERQRHHLQRERLDADRRDPDQSDRRPPTSISPTGRPGR